MKFRVWDKRHKKFVDQSLFYINGDGDLYKNSDEEYYATLGSATVEDDYEVSYSTGLLDKNGKEIFEGHTLTFRRYNSPEFSARAEYLAGYGFIAVPINCFFPTGKNNLFDLMNQYEFITITGNKYETN